MFFLAGPADDDVLSTFDGEHLSSTGAGSDTEDFNDGDGDADMDPAMSVLIGQN